MTDLREVITKALESEGYQPVEGLVGVIMSLMKGDYTVELIKRPICSTCGGSGEINDMASTLPWETPRPCPDCSEKPQKCMRCGVVNSVESAISCHRRYADGTSATGKGGQIGKHRFVDQRKGERRKKGEHRRVFGYPGGEEYKAFTIPGWIEEPLADRRKGDRRK